MANGISTLGQALDQISRLKTQQKNMDLLATQLNTGKKTQRFSGLGTDAIFSQRARTDIKALDSYVMNITNASRRIKTMEDTVGQIKKQATDMLSALQYAMQEGEYPNLNSIREQASNAYDYMIDLLNMQDGDRYLFAGSDTSVKPVNDTGLLNTFMGEFVPDETDINNPPLISSGIIGQWGEGTITTDEFITAYREMSDTTLGYSDSLSQGTAGRVYTHVNEQSEIDYTTLANESGFKEVMVALSVLKSLPPIESAPGGLNDPDAVNAGEDTPPFPSGAKQNNFYAVIDDVVGLLSDAKKNIDEQTYRLSLAQSQLSSIKSSHTQEINTLKTIVADVEDVDTTEVAAKITQLQVQIEASYQVTALTSRLTLVNFL
jgi:flagellar hook-associated protein 3 FlgL